jgi:opacity protein-like surface antigen
VPRKMIVAAVSLCLSLCLISTAAVAAPYVGASAGRSALEANDSGANFSGRATAYKLFGGFRIFKFLGAEGGYVNFGAPKDSTGGVDLKADVTSWDLFGVVALPLTRGFEIFGKAGWVRWDTKVTLSGLTPSSTNSDHGYDFAYGAGVAFKLAGPLHLRFEYERFNISDLDKLHMASAGLDIRF